MFFIPLTSQPNFHLDLPLVLLPFSSEIPATDSSLNADVPEFHPRDYAPKVTFEEKWIDVSESTESCVVGNASIFNELEADSVENCVENDSYDPKLNHTRADTGKKSSKIFYKAELDDKYPNNVTSNNNYKYRARNRLRYNQKGEVNAFDNRNNHDSHIENESINNKASNIDTTAITDINAAKTDKEPAKSEKPENTGRSYAQMLAVSNQNVPIQIEPENLSKFLKPTGKTAISSKIQQSTKPNSRLKNITILKRRSNTPIKNAEVALPAPAGILEWHTVRSKCRKTNALTKDTYFDRITYVEDDATADKKSTLQNQPGKAKKNNEIIDGNWAAALTEDRAIIELHKNSTLRSKSKKKKFTKNNSTKKTKRKDTKFCVVEPNFSKKNNHDDYDEAIIPHSGVVWESVMFASPCPSFEHTSMTPASILRRQTVKADLAGLNKSDLRLRPKFEIFQIDYDSGNIALKKEEEIVIRALQQLNMNDKFEKADTKPNVSIDRTNSNQPSTLDIEGTALDEKADNWDADRFSINAKPHQYSYASNHFLGRFFGDNDDKRNNLNDLESPSLTDIFSGVHNNKTSAEANIHEIFIGSVDVVGKKNLKHFGSIKSLNDLDLNIDNASENELLQSFRDTMTEPTHTTDVNSMEIKGSIATNEIRGGQIECDSNQSEKLDIREKNVSSSTLNDHVQLHVVNTEMLEERKKIQRTFPITTAVSHWLNRAQKEKTPDSILRMPNDGRQSFNAPFDDQLRTTAVAIQHGSQENTDADCYSTDDSCSTNNYQNQQRKYTDSPPSTNRRKHETLDSDDVDEEDDYDYNFTTKSLVHPIYGSNMYYENLLVDEKEYISNYVSSFDANCGSTPKIESDQIIANMKQNESEDRLSTGHDYYVKSPEICCIIM